MQSQANPLQHDAHSDHYSVTIVIIVHNSCTNSAQSEIREIGDSALSTTCRCRVIQKVRLASPETFAEVQKELQALTECCTESQSAVIILCQFVQKDVKSMCEICEREMVAFNIF